MVQRLSDTLVRQIDTHDPFMQIHKIGQKYNDLVDRYNDLEAELEAIKNPTDDQQTDDQSTDEIPATDETDDESEQTVDENAEVTDEDPDDEEEDAE